MSTTELIAQEKQYVLQTYKRPPSCSITAKACISTTSRDENTWTSPRASP